MEAAFKYVIGLGASVMMPVIFTLIGARALAAGMCFVNWKRIRKVQ